MATVQYHATSAFSNPMQIVNSAALVMGVLALPEFVEILPASWFPYIAAATAAINLVLRQYQVRPVAFIKPGETTVVSVPKL